MFFFLQVEVLKPQLTPGIRSKPKKHLVVSQRLQNMIDNLEPDDKVQNHIKMSGMLKHNWCKSAKYVLKNLRTLIWIQIFCSLHMAPSVHTYSYREL